MTRACIALLITALTACGMSERGPLMSAGEDCRSCHGAGTGLEEGPNWSVAGTVFDSFSAGPQEGVGGVEVRLTDKNGRELSLTSNSAGNFYTAERLAFPLQRACVERNGEVFCMRRDVPDGSCNSCHNVPATWAAPGRLLSP
jgi:hypothetical protein